ERVEDGLAHPPHRIGDELDVALRVEAAGRLDEAQRPLVDEVQERHPEAAVALGVGDHEAQVGLHEALQRLLVPHADAPAKLLLVLPGERLEAGDLADVRVQAVAGGAPRLPLRADASGGLPGAGLWLSRHGGQATAKLYDAGSAQYAPMSWRQPSRVTGRRGATAVRARAAAAEVHDPVARYCSPSASEASAASPSSCSRSSGAGQSAGIPP